MKEPKMLSSVPHLQDLCKRLIETIKDRDKSIQKLLEHIERLVGEIDKHGDGEDWKK